MDPVVHFEIPAEDRERAKDFYASVFDWDIEEMPFEDDVYVSVITSPVDDQYMHRERGAINGAITTRDEYSNAPVITIDVPSIEDAVSDIEAAGGRLVVEKGEVADMGYYAYFEDSEGTVVGLWEAIEQGGVDRVK